MQGMVCCNLAAAVPAYLGGYEFRPQHSRRSSETATDRMRKALLLACLGSHCIPGVLLLFLMATGHSKLHSEPSPMNIWLTPVACLLAAMPPGMLN